MDTPLGALVVSLQETSGALAFEPSARREPAVGTWVLPGGRAVLSVVPFAPVLPPRLTVIHAVTLVLRVCAERATPPLVSRAVLEGPPARGGPAGGQNLVAFTWTGAGVELSLGTQDDDSFVLRAEQGLGIPARLAAPLATESPIDLLPTGLQVRLPALEPAEQLAICYVVAWAAETSGNEDASWFAVDVGTVDLAGILAAAG